MAIAYFLLTALAAGIDLRTRSIPNIIPVCVLALAVVARIAGWTSIPWWSMGAGLALGFALPAGMFSLGALGGGDVKLLAALGAALGLSGLLDLFFWTAIAGGALAAMILLGRRRQGNPGTALREDPNGAPDTELAYAPAIAAGMLGAWLLGDIVTAVGIAA